MTMKLCSERFALLL